jgi:biotin synthase-related radical SAM superfamily protein
MNASPTRAAKAHTLCALDQRAADASAASASADEATRALQVIRDELLVSACECAARFAAVEMDLKAARAEADAAAAAADAAEERLYEHLAETTCECDNQLTMVEALVARNSMLEKAFAETGTKDRTVKH